MENRRDADNGSGKDKEKTGVQKDGTCRKDTGRIKHGKETESTVKMEELEGKECLYLRPLWEEVFHEDSPEFTDYYFAVKASRNHAFALKRENGYVAMAHLSPYELTLRTGTSFTGVRASYLVGVATKKEYRHRGYMDALLKASLACLYEEGQPFVFLMPADPEIYRPYQFAYIYDREEYEPSGFLSTVRAELHAASLSEKGRTVTALTKQDLPELAAYADRKLRACQDVFIRRDEAYYRTMEKELRAQNGGCRLLWKETAAGRRLCGYFLYTDEKRPEIQEAVYDGETDAVRRTGRKTPIIMARIVHLKEMLSLLRTKEGETAFRMEVRDPLLTENNGVWSCLFTKEKAEVSVRRPKSPGRVQPSAGGAAAVPEGAGTGEPPADCLVTADRLTAWLFGYERAEKCFTFPDGQDGRRDSNREEILCKLNRVAVLRRVFINEVV